MYVRALILFSSLFLLTNQVPLYHEKLAIQEEIQSYRLPNNSIPEKYEIDITTHLHLESGEKFEFNGKVVIHIKITEISNYISVHSKQLTIISSKIINERNEILEWLNDEQPQKDDKKEIITYHVKDYLYPNEKVRMEIEYTGVLREDNAGFYRSHYIHADGKMKWLASTQFSPADARHAFPCYDEPQIRAVYNVKLTAHKSFHAVSNMPAKSSEEQNEMVTTTFEDTPSMQSYLVAFVISDFDYTEEENQRVYARPQAIKNNEGNFALKVGLDVLQYQQDYFNVSYDLPKMDQLAVPDFAFNAMENWGLVNYREESLIYSEKTPSVFLQKDISNVVAHEFSHQFFGNLVAPNWWYYVWLNEGFATFYQYEFLENLYPQYRARDSMVVNALQFALNRDATEGTRPMTAFIENPNDVFKSSSTFSVYQKAGSVLRMLQLAISEETFKKGVIRYLKSNQYGVADSDDLAAALEHAAYEDNKIPKDLSFKDIIDSWSLKSGYPVLHVSLNDQNLLYLQQQRFSYTSKESIEDDLWLIPVTVASETVPDFSSTSPMMWMANENETISPNEKVKWNVNDWIVVNVQEMGYFRVNYDRQLWMKITEKLKSDSFHEIHHLNRAQLVDDILNMARVNHVPYGSALQLTEYLPKEKEFTAWVSADNGFEYINRLLRDSEVYESFKKYLNAIFSPLYHELGIEDKGMTETYAEKMKRSIGINWACLSGDQECNTETKRLVQEAIVDPMKVPSRDIQDTIYCNGLRYADSEMFTNIWNEMIKNQDQNYRTLIIQGLGCMSYESLQKNYLETTLEKDLYREQEKQDVLNTVIRNGGVQGVETAIDFISEHFKEIEDTYIGVPSPVKNACGTISEFVTQRLMKKYSELLTKMEEEGLTTKNEREQFTRTATENVEWYKRNEEEFRTFFRSFSVKLTPTTFFYLTLFWIVKKLFCY